MSKTREIFEDLTTRRLEPRLGERGFERAARTTWVRQRGEELFDVLKAFLTADRAPGSGKLDLNFGVGNGRANEILYDLVRLHGLSLPVALDRRRGTLFEGNVGFAAPGRRPKSWGFDATTDLCALATEIVAFLDEHVAPVFARLTSVAEVVDLLAPDFSRRPDYAAAAVVELRAAAALAGLGRRTDARRYLADVRARWEPLAASNVNARRHLEQVEILTNALAHS